MSDYTEKNSNLIPKIDIPCFAWNSQAEQGLLFFKAKSLVHGLYAKNMPKIKNMYLEKATCICYNGGS